MSLFKQRREEHRRDALVRDLTKGTLIDHRQSLRKVRSILGNADTTLAEEIQRLDAMLSERTE